MPSSYALSHPFFESTCRCFAWHADQPASQADPWTADWWDHAQVPCHGCCGSLKTGRPHTWRAGHNPGEGHNEGHAGARSADNCAGWTAFARCAFRSLHTVSSFPEETGIRNCSPITMDIVGLLVLQALAARDHVRQCQEDNL